MALKREETLIFQRFTYQKTYSKKLTGGFNLKCHEYQRTHKASRRSAS